MQPPMNTLHYGDCLDVMTGWDDDVADLIYLDPPFNSNAQYNIAASGANRNRARKMPAFDDTWRWDESADERFDGLRGTPAGELLNGLRAAQGSTGRLSYLTYMAERLTELRRVLKPTGTIYLHCDPSANHYLRMLMDVIFGDDNFVSEVIWNYGTPSGGRASGRRPVKAHETLLVYAYSYSQHTFNRLHTDYSDEYIEAWFRHTDEDGRRFQTRSGERRYRTRTRGDEVIRQYLDESPGVPLSNVWSDIRQLYAQRGWFPNTRAQREELGYPTQKPLNLLERVIRLSSDEGDVVLDPFSGSGTTLVAADNLNRRWLGIDISAFAIELTRTHRFQGNDVRVIGAPTDMESARMMAESKPLDFRKWAVTRVPGLIPSAFHDGIDGHGLALDGSGSDEVLVQVQPNGFDPSDLNGLREVVEREGAAMGLCITMHPCGITDQSDTVAFGSSEYPKVQLWSVSQWFDGVQPDLPALASPLTGQPISGALGVGI